MGLYSIIISLVCILIYVIILEYILFMLCMLIRKMTHVTAIIGFMHVRIGLVKVRPSPNSSAAGKGRQL